ncbi:MAG: amino acid-binding protein [Prevotella sp.]|nr:amino acid-binding protein [Prevotella sp.]
MTIKQLSIFIENKDGALLNVLKLLKDNGISIIVSTISDTRDFGIYRIICSDTEKAFRILREKNINVTITNVYALQLADNEVGAAADAMTKIVGAGVSINYMYSFLFGGKGILVFRTDDTQKTEEAIMLNKFEFLSEKDFV